MGWGDRAQMVTPTPKTIGARVCPNHLWGSEQGREKPAQSHGLWKSIPDKDKLMV